MGRDRLWKILRFGGKFPGNGMSPKLTHKLQEALSLAVQQYNTLSQETSKVLEAG